MDDARAQFSQFKGFNDCILSFMAQMKITKVMLCTDLSTIAKGCMSIFAGGRCSDQDSWLFANVATYSISCLLFSLRSRGRVRVLVLRLSFFPGLVSIILDFTAAFPMLTQNFLVVSKLKKYQSDMMINYTC